MKPLKSSDVTAMNLKKLALIFLLILIPAPSIAGPGMMYGWEKEGVRYNWAEMDEKKIMALEKDLKKQYKQARLISRKPMEKGEERKRINKGWRLFGHFCRHCHGFSEKAGQRAEMALSPDLSDDGRLSKTLTDFLRLIYFGIRKMPAYGMGAYDNKIEASEFSFMPAFGTRQLTADEILNVSLYLRFCYRIWGAEVWIPGKDGMELNFDAVEQRSPTKKK